MDYSMSHHLDMSIPLKFFMTNTLVGGKWT